MESLRSSLLAMIVTVLVVVALGPRTTTSSPISGSRNATVNNSSSSSMVNSTSEIEIEYQASYGVLLDAGSSSTKLKVYRWELSDTANGVPSVTPIDVDGNRFKPGLATFENEVAQMKEYLLPILEKAKENVPAGHHSTTPIFVLATAGFRLLGGDDAGTTMKEVEEILMDAGNHPFKFAPGQADVLSGEEEGVYSWLAANYLNGFFNNGLPTSSSVGILEMGGGSTQIAFVPKDGLIMAEEFQVTIARQSHSVYVQSYLKYGATEVKRKVAQELVSDDASNNKANSGGVCTYDNPCMLRDDTQDMTLDSGEEISMVGTGDPQACRSIYRKLLASAPAEGCDLQPCAIGSVFQPSVEGVDFYATSAYKYPLKGIGAIDSKQVNGTVLDLQTLWPKAEQYCQQSINDFPEDSRKWASSDCSGAIYIDTLLTEPYGFSRDTKHIDVTNEIGDESIDWALGAMLHFLSMSFTNNPEHCSVDRK